MMLILSANYHNDEPEDVWAVVGRSAILKLLLVEVDYYHFHEEHVGCYMHFLYLCQSDAQ